MDGSFSDVAEFDKNNIIQVLRLITKKHGATQIVAKMRVDKPYFIIPLHIQGYY